MLQGYTERLACSQILVEMLGYKTLFMLNSAQHEIYPAHKC